MEGAVKTERPSSAWQIAAIVWIALAFAAGFCVMIYLSAPGSGFGLSDTAWDCLALVMLLGVVALIGRRYPRTGICLAIVVAALWMVVLVAQVKFFLISGGFATRSLVLHSFTNLGDIALVAGLALDLNVVTLLAIAVIAFVAVVIAGPERIAARIPFLLKASGGLALFLLASAMFVSPASGAIVGPLVSDADGSGLPTVSEAEMRPYGFQIDGAPKVRPDIVVWVLESTRTDVVKADTVMPFIRGLAARSLKFPLAYTTTSHTSKSLFGLMCGRAPTTTMRIKEAEAGRAAHCLPTALAGQGYRTVFVQTALGEFEDRKALATNVGFEAVVTREDLGGGHQTAGLWAMDERAAIPVMVDAAKKEDGRPLFLTLLTSTSHAPYAMPGSETPEKEWPAAYLEILRHVDDSLALAYKEMGKVFDWNNTVLVVVGDHGEAFGEHGPMQHDQVPFEEVVRVPLFIHYPARFEPRSDFSLRQTVDVLPTLLDTIETPWSGSLQGRSLLGPGHPEVVTSCWETKTCHSYIRADGMKVIFRFGDAPEAVYDLRTDSLERTDVSAAHADLIEQAKRSIAMSRAQADLPH
jgi:arylsulfatase A-like enzyme